MTAEDNSWSQFYVPEIHDVRPGIDRSVNRLLDMLSPEAQACTGILIVPNWQGRIPLTSHGGLGFLDERKYGTVILHGLTHSRGEDLWNWLNYGHDNRSEFARLGSEAIRERVTAGRKAFEDALGLSPKWFCAPRWQQSAPTPAILREAGFRGFELRTRIELYDGTRIPLPAVCFDEGERRLRNAIARNLRAVTIGRLLANKTPFRLTLHPSDLDDHKTLAQLEALIARLNEDGWRPLSLDDVPLRWRACK